MENQLNILSESLDKKLQILQEIKEYNLRQEQAFKAEQAQLEDFDEAVAEKDRLITELTKLDEGFEILYAHLAKQLQENRQQYAGQIAVLQQKIKQVTDLGMSIQAQEARNKKLIEEYFAKARAGLQQNRKTSKAAYDYYKSMSGASLATSQFMDSKQ